ncbi:hypothetical protein [uncultured Methanobrevibacter sp.]|uniref:hypothetical protein n=1 Tax=uncultured Methanobrevibacter sp. TaxID=253161 RepID=UPI0025DC1400|nr:hypothetical protein [uncultured Methanobrevibacter sp.]
MDKDFKKSCNDMTELIESCWDENNPNDGKTFDERLAEKTANLTGTDKMVMTEILGGE